MTLLGNIDTGEIACEAHLPDEIAINLRQWPDLHAYHADSATWERLTETGLTCDTCERGRA
jgi:hypothetical protein